MLEMVHLLGPEEAAKHARPLADEESRLVDEYVVRHGSYSAALGVKHPQLAAEVDALFHR